MSPFLYHFARDTLLSQMMSKTLREMVGEMVIRLLEKVQKTIHFQVWRNFHLFLQRPSLKRGEFFAPPEK